MENKHTHMKYIQEIVDGIAGDLNELNDLSKKNRPTIVKMLPKISKLVRYATECACEKDRNESIMEHTVENDKED
jgi:membrane-bound ClpP family serine protease